MQNKVLLISVDGLRPDALPVCGYEGAVDFFTAGTYSLEATTVVPPVTLPAHMSLFHSVDPERHGTTTNVFMPPHHPIEGLVERLDHAGKTCAFFYNWEELRDLSNPCDHMSFSYFVSWEKYKHRHTGLMCVKAAEEHLAAFAPDFAFLYLVDADEAGHAHGWMSQEYLDAVKECLEGVEKISKQVEDIYTVIVTSDHGGHGRDHGEEIPEDMQIPITFHGARFPKGKKLTNLNIKDIAPTVTTLLGVAPNDKWEGKSIL